MRIGKIWAFTEQDIKGNENFHALLPHRGLRTHSCPSMWPSLLFLLNPVHPSRQLQPPSKTEKSEHHPVAHWSFISFLEDETSPLQHDRQKSELSPALCLLRSPICCLFLSQDPGSSPWHSHPDFLILLW